VAFRTKTEPAATHSVFGGADWWRFSFF